QRGDAGPEPLARLLRPRCDDHGSGASAARLIRSPRISSGEERTNVAMIESKDRATSDPKARKAVLEQIEKQGVEYVLFWFTDIEGHLKSFAITPAEVEEALDDGMGFDGSSITGFNAIEESDMVAIPDPATFRIMPAREREA